MRRPFFLFLVLAPLGACAYLPEVPSVREAFQRDPGRTLSEAPLPLPAVATAPAADPVAAFAASAAPGQSGMAGSEPARVSRAFFAASGRECREVILGSGFGERAQVACRQPDGSFASARPLLMGGAPR